MTPRTISRLIDCLVIIVGAAAIFFITWIYGLHQFDKGYHEAMIDKSVGRVVTEYRVHP